MVSRAAYEAIDARLGEHLGEVPRRWFDFPFYQSVELTDRYGLEWAIELAHRLGLAAVLGRPRGAAELAADLGLVPRFAVALGWILERLAADGLAEAQGDASPSGDPADSDGRRFRMAAPPRPAELAAVRAAALAVDPGNAATFDLLDAAAACYPAVARGETTGEAALLGLGQTALWAAYFKSSNPVYAINNRIAAVAAAHRLRPGGGARLLEVGAGGGSGTEALLAELSARGRQGDLASFTVTEPSPFFRRRAQRELPPAWPGLPLAFAPLDVDLPWEDQGIPPASLDLVYAVNVLHVARDLEAALGRAYAALTPGGWLVAGECLRPFPGQPISAELVFQILEHFLDVATDPVLRPNPGFLTPEQWTRLFARAGFEPFEIAPQVTAIRDYYPRFFTGALCGRRPR